MKPRTRIYIDGYNWYHAIFKHCPEWKWLNIQTFFEALRSREEVISVKMFSSMIDADKPSSDVRDRQEKYFKALKTLPKVSIILGLFQSREVTCRGKCGAKYVVPEEKKTDVNIAVEMMSDAISGDCECMCVVSGDSDIQPAVEWIAKNKKDIKITVYVPALANEERNRRTDYYETKGLDVECRFLPLETLKNHQLNHNVKLPDKTFACRPHSWSISS